MIARFASFFLLFYGALGAGVALRSRRRHAPAVMRAIILGLEPWLFFYSLWVLDLGQLRAYAPIPLMAVALILLPLGLTPALARRLLSAPASQGGFVLAAAFSNIGTTGGAFLCYLLFGQPGLSLAYLFLVPYPFLIFTLGFSLARRYGGERPSLAQAARSLLFDPLSFLPLLAMTAGAACNYLGLRPSAGLAPWVDFLLKADLAIMCLAIGATLEPPNWRRDWAAVAANAGVKFLALPAVAAASAWLIYGSWSPLPAKILILQSAMPSAIYSVVMANLFKLDRELVNTLWISTTLLLAPVSLLVFLFVH